MKIELIAVLGSLMLIGCFSSQTGEGSDFLAYIEEVRASGVSEMGRSQIYSVASCCSGSSVLMFQKNNATGRYLRSYMSTTCPNPEADTAEIKQWKELRLSEADELVDDLKRFADVDGSGFVTTKEASDFRWLVEFGFMVSQVIKDEGPNLDFVVRATGKQAQEAARMIGEYRSLALRINEAGVVYLPDVMVADAGAPFE